MDRLLTAADSAVWSVGLAAAALVLGAATWRTAVPPSAPVPGLDEFFTRWRTNHDGHDPRHGSVWVRGWLITVHRFARPLARAGVSPDVLTLWTVWAALAALAAAAAGGWGPLVAGWLVVFGGVADGLDGAVAVLTGRATRWGYVLDSMVDRLNDLLLAGALVVVGAPGWLAVAYAVLFFQLEYVRARAGNAGGSPVGAITVGERANRLASTAAGLFVAGMFAAHAPTVATGTLGVLVVLSAVGLGQLVVAVRRDLRRSAGRGSGRADEIGHDGRREGDQGHPASRM